MDKVYFQHTFNRHGNPARGGFTVAYRIDTKFKQVVAGVAFCGPKDLYNRKEGRKLALERLYEAPVVVDLICQGDKVFVEETLGELMGSLFYGPHKNYKVSAHNEPYWFNPVPPKTYTDLREWQ
jgi:hypothetical protein